MIKNIARKTLNKVPQSMDTEIKEKKLQTNKKNSTQINAEGSLLFVIIFP